MDLLQRRENAIFETLKGIAKHDFVVIGGYAVNAYALPRFSIDCDIVIEQASQLKKIEKELLRAGYAKKEAGKTTPYGGEFYRYEKEISKDFLVSIDMLLFQVIDRQTHAKFDAEWIFENSTEQLLKGKTITGSIALRIVNVDALLVMKIVSCRTTDIRDIFMLTPKAKSQNWVKAEISKRADFKKRFAKAKEKITSKQFKDNLQGVFGYIDNATFEKHKKAFLELEK